jgi:hypothetical protein
MSECPKPSIVRCDSIFSVRTGNPAHLFASLKVDDNSPSVNCVYRRDCEAVQYTNCSRSEFVINSYSILQELDVSLSKEVVAFEILHSNIFYDRGKSYCIVALG